MIINRYSDDFADYGKYLDHLRHTVSYVTVAGHVPMIPEGAGHVETVADVSDADSVLVAAGLCHRAAGRFDAVLALSEFDLLTAAQVREKFGCAGMDTAATLLFRDKARMKAALAESGVRSPRFATVESVPEVTAFAAALSGPVVVKPRSGAASAGCVVLAEDDDATEVLGGLDLTDHEVEEYVEGPIWHVDGLRYEGEDVFTLPSRYLNTCLGFTQGQWLGSVVQDGPAAERAKALAAEALDALRLTDGPYHLELIEHRDGFVFLEVGARVGGGEIPFTVRDVYGVDLFAEWVRIALGERPSAVPAAPGVYAGFLMFPEPVGHRLVARSSMTDGIPHLYAEQLPDPGRAFTGDGGYEEILGRFRYRGPSPRAVEQAVTRTAAEYAYELEAL
ncbi:biotin carboxylase [Streptomyces populi]|uniref:Biotin carboxylase n=1 Tax=Streptomyces populi TaxID=2058924 RepID=A0A2I0SHC9_9ACTN|nr:biotin carboxylase [Streptomyces populi]